MLAYGTEKPQSYRPRLVDERLQRLLSTFGAVEIRGTKWCGKSWAALAFGESVVRLDDPNVKVWLRLILCWRCRARALTSSMSGRRFPPPGMPRAARSTRPAANVACSFSRALQPRPRMPLPIAVLGASRAWI